MHPSLLVALLVAAGVAQTPQQPSEASAGWALTSGSTHLPGVQSYSLPTPPVMHRLLICESRILRGPHLIPKLPRLEVGGHTRVVPGRLVSGPVGRLLHEQLSRLLPRQLSVDGSLPVGIGIIWYDHPDFALSGHSGLATTAITGPSRRV